MASRRGRGRRGAARRTAATASSGGQAASGVRSVDGEFGGLAASGELDGDSGSLAASRSYPGLCNGPGVEAVALYSLIFSRGS